MGIHGRLRGHMGIHVKEFVCDECGLTFAKGSNLKAHKRTHRSYSQVSSEEVTTKRKRMSKPLDTFSVEIQKLEEQGASGGAELADEVEIANYETINCK